MGSAVQAPEPRLTAGQAQQSGSAGVVPPSPVRHPCSRSLQALQAESLEPSVCAGRGSQQP